MFFQRFPRGAVLSLALKIVLELPVIFIWTAEYLSTDSVISTGRHDEAEGSEKEGLEEAEVVGLAEKKEDKPERANWRQTWQLSRQNVIFLQPSLWAKCKSRAENQSDTNARLCWISNETQHGEHLKPWKHIQQVALGLLRQLLCRKWRLDRNWGSYCRMKRRRFPWGGGKLLKPL